MIVLASRSPRRRQLLEMLGIEHIVEPADIDESVHPGEDPLTAARRIAAFKAETVASMRPDRIVLAADTMVLIDDEILGKPADIQEAHDMLARLSGRPHTVVTAVAMARNGDCSVRHDSTHVTFRALDEGTIRDYVATGEPMDKAGSYGIQGYGAVLIDSIDGDFFSVMGLPVKLVVELLDLFGASYSFTR